MFTLLKCPLTDAGVFWRGKLSLTIRGWNNSANVICRRDFEHRQNKQHVGSHTVSDRLFRCCFNPPPPNSSVFFPSPNTWAPQLGHMFLLQRSHTSCWHSLSLAGLCLYCQRQVKNTFSAVDFSFKVMFVSFRYQSRHRLSSDDKLASRGNILGLLV